MAMTLRTSITYFKDLQIAAHGYFVKVSSLNYCVSYPIIEYRCVSIFTMNNRKVPSL
jgi:hypothetical protein